MPYPLLCKYVLAGKAYSRALRRATSAAAAAAAMPARATPQGGVVGRLGQGFARARGGSLLLRGEGGLLVRLLLGEQGVVLGPGLFLDLYGLVVLGLGGEVDLGVLAGLGRGLLRLGLGGVRGVCGGLCGGEGIVELVLGHGEGGRGVLGGAHGRARGDGRVEVDRAGLGQRRVE